MTRRKSTKRIYMDYASATPIAAEVQKEMRRVERAVFGNPSSIHAEGVAAKKVIDNARMRIARVLEAHSDEIVFTSGGTESNNLAIFGVLEQCRREGVAWNDMEVVTSAVEHASIRAVLDEVKKRGVRVVEVPVGLDGVIAVRDVLKCVSAKTRLVTIQYANSEIGTVQPLRAIFNQIKNGAGSHRPVLHTDASQALLYLQCGQHYSGADLITFDGQKIYGPKGVGALYVRRGTTIVPHSFGGGQEKGLRPGTENNVSVAGFAVACELAHQNRDKEIKRLTTLRDYAFERILNRFPSAELNGSKTERLANNVNVSFPGLDAEFAVLKLDAHGIAVSSKSACDSDELVSKVVLALGKKEDVARSTLRFTFGNDTKKSDIDQLVKILERYVL